MTLQSYFNLGKKKKSSISYELHGGVYSFQLPTDQRQRNAQIYGNPTQNRAGSAYFIWITNTFKIFKLCNIITLICWILISSPATDGAKSHSLRITDSIIHSLSWSESLSRRLIIHKIQSKIAMPNCILLEIFIALLQST